MKIETYSDSADVTFEDKESAIKVTEWGARPNLGPWVTAYVHPRGDIAREVAVDADLRSIRVGEVVLFLTPTEFNELRKKVIDSMIEDGGLIDLSAQARIDVEVAEAVTT